jgi:hypothetical protein
VWDDTPEVTESKTPFDILARQMVNESRRGIHSLVISSWDDVLQPHPAGILKASASGYYFQHSGIYERSLKRNHPIVAQYLADNISRHVTGLLAAMASSSLCQKNQVGLSITY